MLGSCIKAERDLYIDLYRDWLTIFLGRFESPPLYRLDSLLV